MDIHIKMGAVHSRLIEKLMKKTGLDRTAVIKLALYRLGVEEGIPLESSREK